MTLRYCPFSHKQVSRIGYRVIYGCSSPLWRGENKQGQTWISSSVCDGGEHVSEAAEEVARGLLVLQLQRDVGRINHRPLWQRQSSLCATRHTFSGHRRLTRTDSVCTARNTFSWTDARCELCTPRHTLFMDSCPLRTPNS